MGFRERPEYQGWRDAILSAVEIVPIHTSPKRKRGNDLATSLALRVSVSLNREQYIFRLFGRKCIRCGYAGNIHAHHVMPVNEYPELAFEPTNGVPLCGNCHTEIKGDELAHAEDLKRLQRTSLGGEPTGAASNSPSESELREHACAEPFNTEAVTKWFAITTNSQSVVDFYEKHPDEVKKSIRAWTFVLIHLKELQRWQDVIAVADEAKEMAEREGTLEACIGGAKLSALANLGRLSESVAFLQELLSRFPADAASLHYGFSVSMYAFVEHASEKESSRAEKRRAAEMLAEEKQHATEWKEAQLRWKERTHAALTAIIVVAKYLVRMMGHALHQLCQTQRPRQGVKTRAALAWTIRRVRKVDWVLRGWSSRLKTLNEAGKPAAGHLVLEQSSVAPLNAIGESVRDALKAAELLPDRFEYVVWAAFVLGEYGDYATALRYGKRALALASTDEEKVAALMGIASIYMKNDLYADARGHLREVLQIDDGYTNAIGDIALCYHMEGSEREALQMAKRGLMLDPQNKLCQAVCSGFSAALD